MHRFSFRTKRLRGERPPPSPARPALLGAAAALMALALRSAHAQDTDLAYAVADSGDTLVVMNRFDGSGFTVIGNTGTTLIESMSWNVGATTLYAANAGQFGRLSITTGLFTAIGSGLGTGTGSRGALTFDDADGLGVDPLTTIMYASNRETDGSPDDILFQVDVATGAHVPDAFGANVDYVVINTSSLPGPPTLYDVDDVSIDPTDGQMYGIANTSGGSDRLVQIDKATGSVTDVGRLRFSSGTGIDDVEGMSFFNDGALYATTGSAAAASTNNRLWAVDKATGIMTLIGLFGSGTDYEAVGSLTAPANRISGTVFEDVDVDGLFGAGDNAEAGVTVNLYLDVNGNGTVDGGDVLVQTQSSAVDGTYLFLVGSESDFVVELDQGTLPGGATGISTPAEYAVEFTGFGNGSAGNDFGYFTGGAIGDTIFWDLNADGTQDPGEPGIEGVDVTIDLPGGGSVTRTTNVNGMYFYVPAATGDHDVTVDTGTLPYAFPQTADPDGMLDDTTTVSVAAVSDVILTADFGYEFRYLDKSVDKAVASDGETLTYTLYPRHYNDDLLSNVTVIDIVPAGTTFSSAGQGGTLSGGTVTWSLGSNAAGTPSTNSSSAVIYALRGDDQDDFYSYDPSSDSWTTLDLTPNNVEAGGSLAYDGTYLYTMRGSNTNNFYRYNIGTDNWDTRANVPANVDHGGALVRVGAYLYALRGGDTNNFYRFDIGANSWSSMANVAANVDHGGSLVYLDPYLYALRGNNANNFYRYDIGANSWSSMANMPNNVDEGGALTTDGTYLYAFRGNGNTTFYRYDVGANSWSTLANAPQTITNGAALGSVNCGVLFGLRGDFQNDFWEYDIAGNSWSSLADLPANTEWGGSLFTVGQDAEYGASLAAGPTLTTDGDSITVTLTLSSLKVLTGVAPPALTQSGTNGATATYVSGPTPASANIAAGGSAVFTYVYTANDGATPGTVTLTVPTFSSGGGDFLTANANSVIVSPPLTFQVTVDGGAASPISNTGQIEDDSVIPPTDSDTVETFLRRDISGTVINDINANGVDDGEAGIGAVTVELWTDPNGDGDPADGMMDSSTVTAGDGTYSFTDVDPGNWVVVETNLTSWWFSTADTGGANDDRIAVQLTTTDSSGNDFLDAYAWFYWSNTTPGANNDPNPDANTDGDLFEDVEEYAFDQDPSTGVPTNAGFCAMLNTGTGDLDALYIRPIGIPDVIYTLEGLVDLADSPATIGAPGPGGWFEITTIVPSITDNGDGTETVHYEDLESVAVLAGGIGFVRLRLELDSPAYTTHSQVFGWERTINALGCETCSAPFMKKPTFAGFVDSMAGSNLEVATSAGAEDVQAAMSASVEYYVEVVGVGNANEGHRFAVDYGASDADTIAIDTGSSHNTLSPVPDLSGQSIVLRPFWTLGELFDPDDFDATNDPDTADRLLFREPGDAGMWQVMYLLDAPLQWTEQGDIGMADQAGRAIDPCEGLFVHRRQNTGSLLMIGMVRANDFACPLLDGHNLVNGGWPMDQSPVDRDMHLAAGFFLGGTNPAAVDQFHLWRGDAVAGQEGYTGYFLLNAGAPPYQYWTGLSDSLVTNRNTTELFLSNRSALIRVTSDRPTYVMPLPWTP